MDDLQPWTVSKARNEYILVNRNWNKQRNLIKNIFWNDPGVVKNSLGRILAPMIFKWISSVPSAFTLNRCFWINFFVYFNFCSLESLLVLKLFFKPLNNHPIVFLKCSAQLVSNCLSFDAKLRQFDNCWAKHCEKSE